MPPDLIRRDLTPLIEPLPGDAPVIDFVSSDQTLDRYSEVILAAGWRLDNYRKNPVIQNAHQYGDVLFTVGKALVTEIRDTPSGPALFQRVEFATDINPMARVAYGLYKGRFLNAVSVGFLPRKWDDGGADTPFARRYTEQELLEVSAVGIPANPNALQLGITHGAVRKSDLHDLADLITPFLRETPPNPRRDELHESNPFSRRDELHESSPLSHATELAPNTSIREIRALLTAIQNLLRR